MAAVQTKECVTEGLAGNEGNWGNQKGRNKYRYSAIGAEIGPQGEPQELHVTPRHATPQRLTAGLPGAGGTHLSVRCTEKNDRKVLVGQFWLRG